MGLGMWGFYEQLPDGHDRSLSTLAYASLQLFTVQGGLVADPPLPLNVARFLAPIVATSTVVVALVTLFSERVTDLRIRRFRDHVVICGFGRKGTELARGFLARGDRLVVIERAAGNAAIGSCREQGGAVLVGDATSAELLRRAGVRRARHLIAVCGDDATNAEVAAWAYELARDRGGAVLTAVAHIVNPELCNLLRQREIGSDRQDDYRLEFFNIFESGARALLGRYPPRGPDDGRPPHLVVVGLDNLGENVIVQAARDWSLDRPADSPPLGITAIDPRAEQRAAALAVRYSAVAGACRLEALSIDIRGPEFQRAAFLFDSDGACRATAVYVCLEDDADCLSAALTLLQRLHGHGVPVVAVLRRETSLARLLRGDGDDASGLSAFQLIEETCTPELLLGGTYETVARAMHAEWLRTQLAAGRSRQDNPLIVAWEDLPEDARESNRRQAGHIGVKLRAVGCGIRTLVDSDSADFEFRPEEVELIARLEHERWCDDLTAAGWKQGPSDRTRKTHPALLPWDALPEGYKENNRVFVRRLPAFLARAGFQVARRG